jgi:hypothetical protein
MPIEIKELVIRANVDRKVFGGDHTFTEKEKIELKRDILAYCLKNLETKQSIGQKKTLNSINR